MKNTSKIIRKKHNKNSHYTCISNEILQSKTLSTDEKSVLVHFLSLPETWIINKTTNWKIMNIGRERFYKAWDELEKAGYIVSTKLKGKNNLIVGYHHVIYEEPLKPDSDLPETGEPENQSNQEPVRKESNEHECDISECDISESNISRGINTGDDTGDDTGVTFEFYKLDFNKASIEELQNAYMHQSYALKLKKEEIIKAAKGGTNIMSIVNENDLSKLARVIGEDKLEQVKPLIDQYFALDSIGKKIWTKINAAHEKIK
jgi:hypothetical protein